jgi:hypothetical protein
VKKLFYNMVLAFSVKKKTFHSGKYVLTHLMNGNLWSLSLTVRTSVKLRSDVTDSPVFTHFKEIAVPSEPVMNTFTLPLWITYTFSSGSPRNITFHYHSHPLNKTKMGVIQIGVYVFHKCIPSLHVYIHMSLACMFIYYSYRAEELKCFFISLNV